MTTRTQTTYVSARKPRAAMFLLATAACILPSGAFAQTPKPVPPLPPQTVSTVPSNGGVNPYGVAFVPRAFSTNGLLQPPVSNFNNNANLQGTGTTIVRIDTHGKQALFFQGQTGLWDFCAPVPASITAWTRPLWYWGLRCRVLGRPGQWRCLRTGNYDHWERNCLPDRGRQPEHSDHVDCAIELNRCKFYCVSTTWRGAEAASGPLSRPGLESMEQPPDFISCQPAECSSYK